jgi:tRNA pseudouridine13 synthase
MNVSVRLKTDPAQINRFDDFAHAWPQLNVSADFKRLPEDFIVEESLPFELSGEGEHDWLYVRKRETNTDWLAQQLARFAGVKPVAVGYAGMKDRYAVTSQWFSVHLPGRSDVDWGALSIPGVELLQNTRHARKLQRGALKHNRFTIRLRDVTGDTALLPARCELIRQQGVPNYFGEQRFGHGLDNLRRAEAMFREPRRKLPRHKRSLYLSAARSWLFNCMLNERIACASWNSRIDGDVFMLDGRSACFADDASDDLAQRLQHGEIHPTAALWGQGEYLAAGECASIETSVVDALPVFSQGLIDARLDAQRRSMRLMLRDIDIRLEAGDAVLAFDLPAGSYATMVLRELLHCRSSATIGAE